MKFYGVGVKYGGADDRLADFMENSFWCMGHGEHENFEQIISGVNVGDVVFAKSFSHSHPEQFNVWAVGFVTSKSMPDGIPDEYKNKIGFSVSWTTVFESKLHLVSCKDFMPYGFQKGMPLNNRREGTIYQETNSSMILKVIEEMNGPY